MQEDKCSNRQLSPKFNPQKLSNKNKLYTLKNFESELKRSIGDITDSKISILNKTLMNGNSAKFNVNELKSTQALLNKSLVDSKRSYSPLKILQLNRSSVETAPPFKTNTKENILCRKSVRQKILNQDLLSIGSESNNAHPQQINTPGRISINIPNVEFKLILANSKLSMKSNKIMTKSDSFPFKNSKIATARKQNDYANSFDQKYDIIKSNRSGLCGQKISSQVHVSSKGIPPRKFQK